MTPLKHLQIMGIEGAMIVNNPLNKALLLGGECGWHRGEGLKFP